MREKISRSIMILVIGLLILVSLLFCVALYFQQKVNIEADIKQFAYVFENNTASEVLPVVRERDNFDLRITLVNELGGVFFDSKSNILEMENHKDRAEIKNAFLHGKAESTRYSETIGESYYFYSVLLADGTVLRIGKTMRSMIGIVFEMLPVIILILIGAIVVGYCFAAWLTKMIVKPINDVKINEISDSPYEELNPFIKTIIEQREAIENQVTEAQNRTNTIETMMNSMKEGLIAVDKKGTIISINDSAYSYFLADKAYIGSNIISLFRDIDFLEKFKESLKGMRAEMDFEHNGKAFKVFFSPVNRSGVIILFLDVTEKMNIEKLRREFSANVSHELKTPLSTIMGNAEMLVEGMVKKEDENLFYKKIHEEASRLISLIDDIMLISKLDEGAETVLDDMDLTEAAKAVISHLKSKADAKKVIIDFDGKEMMFRANKAQMYELIFNLLDNGIKYNKIGGNLELKLSNGENGRAIIMVKDTGIGISNEDQERIFERFYTVDKSRSKETGGTGLGLSIVKHIVQTYNGEIALESTLGKGTTITISLGGC